MFFLLNDWIIWMSAAFRGCDKVTLNIISSKLLLSSTIEMPIAILTQGPSKEAIAFIALSDSYNTLSYKTKPI
jgi:hypothetical protein